MSGHGDWKAKKIKELSAFINKHIVFWPAPKKTKKTDLKSMKITKKTTK